MRKAQNKLKLGKLEYIGLSVTILAICGIAATLFFIPKNNTLVDPTGQNRSVCGNKVDNWKEDLDEVVFSDGSKAKAGYSRTIPNYSNIITSINFSTATCLGIMDSANNRLDTGDDYLFVNPANDHYGIISSEKIEQLQDDGELCLTTEQAWNNVGKKRTCVSFVPTKLVHSNDFIFLNEKADYVNGFTATITHDRLIKWDDAVSDYHGKQVVVSGTIEEYQNHPEIKIYDLSQITPNTELYAYSSKYGPVYKSANSRL